MRSTNIELSQLVVTGSSAGGIEALSRVLATLPADFPAPIVMAQHLDPRVPSSLAAILAKRTALKIVAVDGSATLKPATVYVVPADRHVEISEGTVNVHANGIHGRPKPSIDLLFASAAEVYGDRLVAVILSGLGADGSDGAQAVKRNGGIVIVEDPMTASFASMPGSVAPELVDFSLPLDRIGAELIRLAQESIDLPDDLPALEDLLERVREASGIDFSHYKVPTIKRRLARQIHASGRKTLVAYLALLDEDPTEFSRLVSNFLIKVTEFFRDRATFEALRDTIVPAIVAQARERGGRELRLWSAGCATGEEAYSLAILVADALREDTEIFNVRIFATDIDEAAISFARRGIYPLDSVANVEPELLDRYFLRVEGGWEVGKVIRNMTVFGQHDLGQRAPFPRVDLALCRNVLIYFSKHLQQRTLGVFAFSLRDGGYLVLGKAESTSPLAQYFAPVDATLRIYRRQGDRVTIPAAQPRQVSAAEREIERSGRPFPAFESSPREGRTTTNEKLGAFLTSSSIGVILVDREYDIVAINAAARAMFGIHGIAVGEDVVHLMSAESAGHVRILLDAALRNQQPKAGGEEIAVRSDIEETRYVTISCYPEVDETTRAVTAAVILAVDVTDLALARHASQVTIELQAHELTQLRQAGTHARERQHSLVEANKQLAGVNSELRAHNDALVISAEEAQASTEEIETLNEEMQATNEELETLNEEFQATIEELNTTNDEHAARGTDLQDQLTAGSEQRNVTQATLGALFSIVNQLSNAVAAVDAQGAIVATNERFSEIMSGAPESSVQIDDEAGATISLSVVLRRAGAGREFDFVYRSIAPDQSLTVYYGRATPQSGSNATRSIIELNPAPNE